MLWNKIMQARDYAEISVRASLRRQPTDIDLEEVKQEPC